MKTLDKFSHQYIKKLVEENDLKGIIAFCKGLGIDTNHYSSPVHYKDGQLTIRYRSKNKYFIIF